MDDVDPVQVVGAEGPADGPVAWAAGQLRRAVPALATAGDGLAAGTIPRVAIRRPGDPGWELLLHSVGASAPLPSEAFVILATGPDPASGGASGGADVVVGGADDRGLVYGLLELADTITHAGSTDVLRTGIRSRYEHAHVPIRGITRLYTSHRLDHDWLHDPTFWDDYLGELATHRFNRFTLAFGLGYDFLIDRRVVDNELCFLYPFVLDVPGHRVEVRGVDADARERNLRALRHVATAAVRRGLQFGLGLWNHAPRLEPGEPTERWLVTPPRDHARYCGDALAMLLEAIPEISTLTLRVHFEGGVPEPTHAFWREVVGAVTRVDRPVALDAHAKGIDDRLLDALRSAGSSLTLSTKYWGEHMGLPYHQAAIREKEFAGHRRGLPPPAWDPQATTDPEPPGGGASQAAERGSGRGGGGETTRRRSFTRYGYGDFADPAIGVDLLHRVWPGTQRVLVTPDPATAAGIGRQATFAGSSGVEWFDALTFLGKKNSAEHPIHGAPAVEREMYRDDRLAASDASGWRKYQPQLRLWGRLSYDPAADPEGWRRWYTDRFAAAAADAEAAAAHAARILPLITTAHAPSVAGNIYWPEMDTPIPILGLPAEEPDAATAEGWHHDARFDMVAPYTFGNTSPLDPELFATPDQFVDALLAGEPTARFGPDDVASWLDTLASAALGHADAAERIVDVPDPITLRRLLIDARIAAHLGAFFAAKLRASAGWRLHTRTGRRDALDRCRRDYTAGRGHWARAVDVAEVYRDDIPFGHMPYQRGHWRDRLPAIDQDLAAIDDHASRCDCGDGPDAVAWERAAVSIEHRPPDRFSVGDPLRLEFVIDPPGLTATVCFRQVDQSRRWQRLTMASDAGPRHSAVIPASFCTDHAALQYYVELRSVGGAGRPAQVAMWPGLTPPELSGQPYLVVHPDATTAWGRT